MGNLTPKQERFVQEYIVDLNASAACLRAGYRSKNPDVDGYNLLVKPSISSAIQTHIKEREKRTEVTADMVVQQLYKIAYCDITRFVTWGADGIDIKPSGEVDGTIIAEVSDDITDYGSHKRTKKKLKLPDRMKALELLGRHTGAFDNDITVKGNLGVTIVDDVDELD